MTPVASAELLIVTAAGEETLVTAALGRPHRARTGEWRCPVQLTGLYTNLAEMAGDDSLQALCMGASLIRALLEGVVEEGGRVLHPSDRSAYPLDAVFGRVRRTPGESAS